MVKTSKNACNTLHYGFNGKEEQNELNLNWQDFGARNYDPAIGRWLSPDPLAEEFWDWSPYNAMNDNPLTFIDPTGMAAEDIRIYGKNSSGDRELILNLETDDIDVDIETDIGTDGLKSIPSFSDANPAIPPREKGKEKAILGSHDINKYTKLLDNLDANQNVVISAGIEGSVVDGSGVSIDLVLFKDKVSQDFAAGVYTTEAEDTGGVFIGAGVRAGVVTSKSRNPLTLEDFAGRSTSVSAGLVKAGGEYVNSSKYSGLLIDIPKAGTGAGLHWLKNRTTLNKAYGNVEKFSNKLSN